MTSPAAHTSRADNIAALLQGRFNPVELQVRDQSHLHAGHEGARSGKGHFSVTIVSTEFAGLSRLARHRVIYQALAASMETDIHALTIIARCPGEH